MSIEEKQVANLVEAELARLLGGREPSHAALDRCPTLVRYRLTVADVGRERRGIVIRGTASSDRFTVLKGNEAGGEVLWLDRKRRFALTRTRMWVLGEEEREVGLDWTTDD
jgi:hypothetical protein